MQFETWLRKQRNKKNKIGDLARYWIEFDCPKPFTLPYLENTDVENHVLDTYKAALRAYIKAIYLNPIE